MTKTTAKPQGDSTSEEAKVIDYLQKNPEVLMSYPEVFTALSIPHHGGDVVSLVERQLKILRNENRKIKKKLDELVNIARDNEELNQRFHRLALELLNTDAFDDVLAMVQDQVQTFFYTDFVCFKFLPEITDKKKRLENHYLDSKSGIVDTVKPWLEKRKPVCGRLDEKVNRELFGSEVKVESSALIPLYHTAEIGLLCLGSVSKERFNKSMGTIFLGQLGELVSSRIQGILGAARA
jgi:uncharacterized protein YigA (DUF484 family)